MPEVVLLRQISPATSEPWILAYRTRNRYEEFESYESERDARAATHRAEHDE